MEAHTISLAQFKVLRRSRRRCNLLRGIARTLPRGPQPHVAVSKRKGEAVPLRRMNYAELKTDLFGEDETAENWIMLKIVLQSQDAHLVVRGELEIRSNSRDLCDLARDKVIMLEKKPEMIKF
ncbi:unnamed protein product [Eruca vesicaria subsp. sativa]|uniref:Uncharacterized protein n=1 Tax=Eruca vesicaria subsp. sativa TaxID=29727 RepID=A0ABC8J739_ERUVS|nr:unnamed protein product [Eruca vesicaria subsp. sativa]